jgi:hypothetical protein
LTGFLPELEVIWEKDILICQILTKILVVVKAKSLVWGSMLWSLFSAILQIFGKKVVFS